MIKSIQIELVKPPNSDFVILLKDCKRLLEPKGTIEINSTPRILPVPRAKSGTSGEGGITEEDAQENSQITKMLREAGFSNKISMTQSTHLGSVRTHVITTA